ncbi:MAG: hypothetical protein GYB68_17060 [Chloroflexi bacterium]|nr:hypothetical protein [Chloroflexota bacterium]
MTTDGSVGSSGYIGGADARADTQPQPRHAAQEHHSGAACLLLRPEGDYGVGGGYRTQTDYETFDEVVTRLNQSFGGQAYRSSTRFTIPKNKMASVGEDNWHVELRVGCPGAST